MTINDIAERVLFAETLEEKLLLGDLQVSDSAGARAVSTPDAPGRPEGLWVGPKDSRVEFPSLSKIDDDRERGVLLHFLANHELLAAELMALNLLKFPGAPAEYRAGVYTAMREEQIHTQLYLRRMRECGIEFGELPVNDYFWRLIAGVESPMDFVARLNLTFEQANLDFAKHYAALFREAGDPSTSAVLEKIYIDEIGHVGHGVKWFRRWKDEGDSDWEAFRKVLSFPMAPVRAKGMAPFNAEGRRLAGFDEDFISNLEVCEQSRGRTPALHWFNPNAELCARGEVPQLNKFARAMEEDLEMVMIAMCRRDDVLLVRQPPSREHLAGLQRAGVGLPEIVAVGEVGERKLSGLRPWAWSPDAAATLEPFAGQVSEKMPWQWREAIPAEWLSKAVGLRLEKLLGLEPGGVICKDVESARAQMRSGSTLFKAPYACAGRGHYKAERDGDKLREWLAAVIDKQGFVVAEPWLERVVDFSALYEMGADGKIEWLGWTVIENDDAGRFRGIEVSPKWSRLLDKEVSEFLFKEARVAECYRDRIPAVLGELLPGYVGPVGIDAMVHRLADGKLALRAVVEANVRVTMGRIALELQKKLAPERAGRFRVIKKGSEVGDGIVLNDPQNAREFLAVWHRHPADVRGCGVPPQR